MFLWVSDVGALGLRGLEFRSARLPASGFRILGLSRLPSRARSGKSLKTRTLPGSFGWEDSRGIG